MTLPIRSTSFDGVTEVIRRVNPDIVCLQEFNRTSSKAEELDSLLSDGTAAREEQMLLAQFMQAFGVSEERFKPFFEVIALKNDRSVFVKQDHPSNQPGHRVSLSKG